MRNLTLVFLAISALGAAGCKRGDSTNATPDASVTVTSAVIETPAPTIIIETPQQPPPVINVQPSTTVMMAPNAQTATPPANVNQTTQTNAPTPPTDNGVHVISPTPMLPVTNPSGMNAPATNTQNTMSPNASPNPSAAPPTPFWGTAGTSNPTNVQNAPNAPTTGGAGAGGVAPGQATGGAGAGGVAPGQASGGAGQ